MPSPFQGFQASQVGASEEEVLPSSEAFQVPPSVLRASEEDKQIANPRLSAELRQRIAGAKNLNNSDLDFCEYGGELLINYSWGNQQGIEFLAEAIFPGTEKQFLRAWFPGR